MSTFLTSRDQETWFDQRPTHPRIDPELAEARRQYEQAWQDYDALIESNATPDELAAARQEANYLQHKASQVYRRLNGCKHEHVSSSGSQRIVAGNAVDDLKIVCDDCGLEL